MIYIYIYIYILLWIILQNVQARHSLVCYWAQLIIHAYMIHLAQMDTGSYWLCQQNYVYGKDNEFEFEKTRQSYTAAKHTFTSIWCSCTCKLLLTAFKHACFSCSMSNHSFEPCRHARAIGQSLKCLNLTAELLDIASCRLPHKWLLRTPMLQ